MKVTVAHAVGTLFLASALMVGCSSSNSPATVATEGDITGTSDTASATDDSATPGSGADTGAIDESDALPGTDDTAAEPPDAVTGDEDAPGADAEPAPDTSEAVDATEPTDVAGDIAGSEDTTAPLPPFTVCSGAPFTPAPEAGFDHTTSSITATLGDPEHSAQDVIALPNTTTAIPGKFAYGTISKDLEDELVEVFIDHCKGWHSLGTVKTNADGRTSRSMGPELTTDIGVFDVRQAVLGDASVVPSQVRVLPAGTKFIVFDIDGTLTTADEEVFKDAIADFFEPLFGGTYVPTAYPDAVALTTAWANKGYVLLYMTGRPYWLTRITREWVASLGLASASLHVTDSNAEALPTEGGVGTYKAEYLKGLTAMGYELFAAYGNATTDIYAYEQAGIPKARTFIIGAHGGEAGTQAVVDGYTAHLPWIATQPEAAQPFAP